MPSRYDSCTIDTCPIEDSVYGYRPSLAASGVLIALYTICMGIQVVMGLHYKTWWFMICMVLGCLVEILGYAGRILYWQDPWAQSGFIMQIVLITIGPVFFSGSIYVLASNIVNAVSPSHARFNPKYYIWTFLPCDIVCLILQAVGGAMSSTSNGKSTAGVDIALAGLALQVATTVAFAVLMIDYYIRTRSIWLSGQLSGRFKIFTVAMSAATIFILIRCCYRVYELAGGYTRDNAGLRDQPLFIGLESVMIILAAYCLIVAHPGPVFRTQQPVSDSKMEEASS